MIQQPLHSRVTGFTLIEILVVLLIISIVACTALLTISHNSNRQIESFAHELTQMLMLAEEQAMLQPKVLGLSLSKHSLQFTSYEPADDGEKNNWIPLQVPALSRHNIPGDIQVRVDVANDSSSETTKNNPQIIISTNGDITPFTIYVGKNGERPRYAITGDADGSVTNRYLS